MNRNHALIFYKYRRRSVEKTREPAIQVKNLYKIFRVGNEKVRALNGVDLTIYKGEFCAIVGTSGSGKSTMLNMLAGLEKLSAGETAQTVLRLYDGDGVRYSGADTQAVEFAQYLLGNTEGVYQLTSE